jgi:hypothetical protein
MKTRIMALMFIGLATGSCSWTRDVQLNPRVIVMDADEAFVFDTLMQVAPEDTLETAARQLQILTPPTR